MQKELVDAIYKEKARNDSNSRDLANTLNVLAKTVFGEVNRFVFELLQNADDSSDSGGAVDVQFLLTDNYLIFSHNGKHFTEQDVRGIAGVGNRASEKDKNIEKTGYKGIGFKSVFGTSDYAHIISGDFSFRFEKSHSAFDPVEEFPWQVVPIWTEEPVAEVKGLFDLNRVNTIIQVSNKEVIKEEIIKVFSDCQIILFLRNVKSVTFVDGKETILIVTKTNENGVTNLYNNNVLESSWILNSMVLNISSELTDKLSALSETECPRKLKEAKTSKLTFAAQVQDGQLIPAKRTVIYSYLPTKAKKGFSFLINGDFLTNAERTELMQNVWNEFLFEEIARLQLEWFRELQQTDYRFDILKLLKAKYGTYETDKTDIAFNKELEIAAADVDFVPEQENDGETMVITHSVVDTALFSSIFPVKLITDHLNVTGTHGVADLRLSKQTILIELGAKQFTFNKIFELISAGSIKDVISAVRLMVFFYNNTINEKNPNWLSQLSTATFILDQNGIFKTPHEIFIPLATDAASSAYPNLSYVNVSILDHFSALPYFLEWLHNLGVREPTELEIVRKSIIPLIESKGINEQNALSFTELVFGVFQSGSLTDQDYGKLSKLPVLTSNGLKPTKQCYLSDEYNPEKKLLAILPQANFLSNIYLGNETDPTEWKHFFKKLGVRENITIDVIEETLERQKFEQNHPESIPYFTWLENTKAFADIYHTYRYSGQHYIQNFTAMEFQAHLSGVEFSKFFWGKMLENWDNFKSKCNVSVYLFRNGSAKVPSFVQYYVKNVACLPCTNGKTYRSVDVFSPSLKSIIGTLLPVADLPMAMTNEQVEFFGFKKVIKTAECLSLLVQLSNQPSSGDTTKQIFSIYDQLIGQSSNNDEATKGHIETWRQTANVLSINNSFQPVKDMFIFNVHGTPAPVNSERFLKLPSNRSSDELKALSDFLQIPVITFDLLEFVAVGSQEEMELKTVLANRVAFLALVHAHNTGDNYQTTVARLDRKIGSTDFFQAYELSLVYEVAIGDVIFNSKINSWNGKANEFYFTGKWTSPLTVYSLSNSLCGLLDLQNMEREFGLFLQLNNNEIHQWLLDQGYKVEDLHFENLFNPQGREIDDNQHLDEPSPYDGIDIFVETVKVTDIDYTEVTPITRSFSGNYITSTTAYAPVQNEQVKQEMGLWSEEHVNNYLKNNQATYTSIEWMNEAGESYLPYDFKVIENGVLKHIEVKGTSSQNKELFFISESEWKIIFQEAENYSLFSVFGAGTVDNRIERTDNLSSLLSQGNFITFPIELRIL